MTWLSVPRGGYGYCCAVNATVLRCTRSRVVIQVQTVDGRVVQRTVRPESLRLWAGKERAG